MKILLPATIYLLLFFASTTTAQTNSEDIKRNKEIVFTSDTQGPILLETLWLKPNRNRSATNKIFSDILQKEPEGMYILGDVVSWGSSNRQWEKMDLHLKKLRDKGIKVSAAMGNHDIMWNARKGERKFKKYFPDYVKTGFYKVTDSVAIVLLNSNFRNISNYEDSLQVNWYTQTLAKLDADSSIQFIITGCHHSPYTNGKLVGLSSKVREKFVSKFMKSIKSKLFLSGHTHAYEHYNVEGKDFMVIGGGGGLHETLNPGNKSLPDLATGYKPMFHYLTVKREADKLQVTSISLKKDFSGFEEGEKLTIEKHFRNVISGDAVKAAVTLSNGVKQ